MCGCAKTLSRDTIFLILTVRLQISSSFLLTGIDSFTSGAQATKITITIIIYATEPHDISSLFVLPVKKSQAPSQTPSIVAKRLVAVKFVRRSVRDDIYAVRVKLATFNRSTSNKIYINEDFHPAKRLLFSELQELAITKKILGVWS